jgi:hypothetical protein
LPKSEEANQVVRSFNGKQHRVACLERGRPTSCRDCAGNALIKMRIQQLRNLCGVGARDGEPSLTVSVPFLIPGIRECSQRNNQPDEGYGRERSKHPSPASLGALSASRCLGLALELCTLSLANVAGAPIEHRGAENIMKDLVPRRRIPKWRGDGAKDTRAAGEPL